jgi:hypothetical protein
MEKAELESIIAEIRSDQINADPLAPHGLEGNGLVRRRSLEL